MSAFLIGIGFKMPRTRIIVYSGLPADAHGLRRRSENERNLIKTDFALVRGGAGGLWPYWRRKAVSTPRIC
jgi:hypothetical protein